MQLREQPWRKRRLAPGLAPGFYSFERFDRIASVGMSEHVGARNYRTFMEARTSVPSRRWGFPAAYNRKKTSAIEHPIQSQFGERFHRVWRYYLLSCAGLFRARGTQLWQWVFSKNGIAGGYHRPQRMAVSTSDHEGNARRGSPDYASPINSGCSCRWRATSQGFGQF